MKKFIEIIKKSPVKSALIITAVFIGILCFVGDKNEIPSPPVVYVPDYVVPEKHLHYELESRIDKLEKLVNALESESSSIEDKAESAGYKANELERKIEALQMDLNSKADRY